MGQLALYLLCLCYCISFGSACTRLSSTAAPTSTVEPTTTPQPTTPVPNNIASPQIAPQLPRERQGPEPPKSLVSEIRKDLEVPSLPLTCQSKCSTNALHLGVDSEPPLMIDDSFTSFECGGRIAEEGDLLIASCDDIIASVGFTGGVQQESDTFETDIDLVCTSDGWTYVDELLAIDEVVLSIGARRLKCVI